MQIYCLNELQLSTYFFENDKDKIGLILHLSVHILPTVLNFHKNLKNGKIDV